MLGYVLTAVLSIAVTALVMAVYQRAVAKKNRDREHDETMRTIRRIAREREEANAVIASLDLGILAYGSDHRLVAANRHSEEMLGQKPETVDEFFHLFGTQNGMLASFMLGKPEVSGLYEREGRVYRLVSSRRELDRADGVFEGHVIMIQDVTDAHRLEEERRAFVANVSHELKTPLTTIKTYSETLLDWGLAEKEKSAVAKDIMRIYDDALRMEALIADLLLLSSIDSRAHYIRARICDLGTIAERVTERFLFEAEEKKNRLECLIVANRPLVFGDVNALERILTNLVSNAIKYTGPKGTIRVSVGRVGGDLYVKVRDNGIGIPKKAIGHLFERFYRVDKTGSRRFGGTGLGLSIALELTEMHRGRLEVESWVRRGSEFTLFLPSAERLLTSVFRDMARGETIEDALGIAATKQIATYLSRGDLQEMSLSRANETDLAALLEKIREKVNNES